MPLEKDTNVQLSEIETTDDLMILKFVTPERAAPTSPEDGTAQPQGQGASQ